MTVELDYMEYADDATAQATYVSDDINPASPVSWDLLDEDCSGIGDWINGDTDTAVSEVDPAGQFRMDTNSGAAGNAKALISRDISLAAAIYTVEIKLFHDDIGIIDNLDYFEMQLFNGTYSFRVKWETGGIFVETNASAWPEIGTNLVKDAGSAEWQTWRFVVNMTDGNLDVYLNDSTHDWEKVATGINPKKTDTGNSGIIKLYQYGYTTDDMVTHIDHIKIVTGSYSLALQCYSEDTIKEQGSYSLKGVALQTDSLNDTLTRTIGSPIDLSGQTVIKIDARASREGSQFKIGIHDSGGTTSEHTVNIASANIWQTDSWNISGIAATDKDAIDSIIVTILNADANNIFYIDNMYGDISGAGDAGKFGILFEMWGW